MYFLLIKNNEIITVFFLGKLRLQHSINTDKNQAIVLYFYYIGINIFFNRSRAPSCLLAGNPNPHVEHKYHHQLSYRYFIGVEIRLNYCIGIILNENWAQLSCLHHIKQTIYPNFVSVLYWPAPNLVLANPGQSRSQSWVAP